MGERAIVDQSLRAWFARGADGARGARRVLASYDGLLQDVFPIAGELESVAAYDAYLRDPALAWDIVVLTDAATGAIVGGIQWQVLRDLDLAWLDALAWIEHVWLVPEARSYPTFRGLLRTVRKHMRELKVDTAFLEFNDPDKMTPLEVERDAIGGLSPSDRLRLWARVGVCELVSATPDGRRVPVPYAQPAMDGGPPVRMLSLGFYSLDRDLTQVHLHARDYLHILHRAHATIRGLDPATDPTCREYTAAILALQIAQLELSPLSRRLSTGGHGGPRRG